MNLKQLKNLVPQKLLPPAKRKVNFPFGYQPKAWHLVVFLTLIVVCYLYFSKDDARDRIPVEINGHVIRAEIADSPKEQALGLMFRKSLPENSGMLFLFEQDAKHSFWMKNTKIPLDIIWINSRKEIVHIEHSVPPCPESPCLSYRPLANARYVLETNGGWTIKNGVKTGDTVNF